MSELPPTYDDEIDLFEFFETLWEGKWLISAFIALAVLIGFGYTQVAKPKYEVLVPYTFNLYSISAQQICGGNVPCIEDEGSKRLMTLLDGDWSKAKESTKLSLTTHTPSDVDYYADLLQRYNQTITSEMLNEANDELTVIQTELNDALLGTERVATNMLNAKRLIQSIDSGQTAIAFGSPSITKSFPRVALIVAMSVVLGGMIGVFFIFVRNVIRNRKV